MFETFSRFFRQHRTACIILALALLTFLVYWPVSHDGFIELDDPVYVVSNVRIHSGLTWRAVLWAFRTGYASNWHPLTWISHMLDCQLYGPNPSGHHLTSLLFHVANTVLLFLLLRSLTGATWRAAFVAALFGWHPLHVESVAWVAERKDVLSTFFWILTLMAYTRYVRRPGWKWYAGALLLFILGLMSKPMVVTLPFVLLLLDFWPLNRVAGFTQPALDSEIGQTALAPAQKPTVLLLEKLPFFALSLVSSVVTYLVQKSGGAVSPFTTVSISVRAENALLSYWRYLFKAVWPAHLAIIYPYSRNLSAIAAIFAGLALAGVCGLFLCVARRKPYLLTGWLWFLGTLVPTIGIIQVGVQSMADRYMYIPSIGLFISIVWGAHDLFQQLPRGRAILSLAGSAALAGCLAATRIQLGYWKNGAQLFRHAIAVDSNNPMAYVGLATALYNEGKRQDVLALYAQALHMDPRLPLGEYNCGTTLLRMGRVREAVNLLEIAVREHPRYADAQTNLGKALMAQGKWDQAAKHLSIAARLQPDDPEAHYNLGTVFLMQQRYTAAADELSRALQLNPDYPAAHQNRAVSLMQSGKPAEALEQFSQWVRLAPSDPQAHYNYGVALLAQNQPSQAAAQLTESLELKPDSAAAHYRLALALAQEHQTVEAIAHCRQAVRLQPDFPQARKELDSLLNKSPGPTL